MIIGTVLKLVFGGVADDRKPIFAGFLEPVLYLHQSVQNRIAAKPGSGTGLDNDRDAQRITAGGIDRVVKR